MRDEHLDERQTGLVLIFASLVFIAFFILFEIVVALTWGTDGDVISSQEMVLGMLAIGVFVLVLLKGIRLFRGR